MADILIYFRCCYLIYSIITKNFETHWKRLSLWQIVLIDIFITNNSFFIYAVVIVGIDCKSNFESVSYLFKVFLNHCKHVFFFFSVLNCGKSSLPFSGNTQFAVMVVNLPQQFCFSRTSSVATILHFSSNFHNRSILRTDVRIFIRFRFRFNYILA